jgi:NADPH2:quinone reductase
MEGKSMGYKRVVITEFGGPQVLRVVEEASLPEPGPGEVRVKVLATSAAFTDTMIRKGEYRDVKEKPPFTLGYDMVGEVDALGPGATRFEIGQRVADLTQIGSYTQYRCLPEERLVPVPQGLDSAQAVSLVLTYVTAYQMLHHAAGVQPGQRILVHGAGGAVGSALLQLGKLAGLEVYGTASKAKHDLVAGLGATPIDYRSEDFTERFRAAGQGLDAVFDPIGGENFKRSFGVLNRGGTLVVYGFYNAATGRGGNVPLDYLRVLLWNLLPNGRAATFYLITAWRKKDPGRFARDLEALFELLAEGQIEPVIDRRLSLTEAAAAHELIDRAAVEGKIVLLPQELPGAERATTL